MSFQEKSAWGVLIGLGVVSVWYFPAAFAVVAAVDSAVPLIGLIVGGTIALVVIEVVYHTIVAAWSPKSAGVADERDHLIDLKSERNAGFVLGFSLFGLIGWILTQNVLNAEAVPGSLAIVVWIMLAITVAEMSKFASQVWFYRAGA